MQRYIAPIDWVTKSVLMNNIFILEGSWVQRYALYRTNKYRVQFERKMGQSYASAHT